MASTAVLDEGVLAELRAELGGVVIAPGDPDYDAARTLHNAMIDKRPAAIARCTGVAHVKAALGFGLAQGLEVAIRGGGHNVAGKALCDGGLVIDLSALKGSASTRRHSPCARSRASRGASSTARRRCLASRRPAAPSRPPVSRA
jgi:FAD/FMN-containing dehydrogenase